MAGQDVLVVGGGSVAARKVAGLLQAGARVRVISPSFVAELEHRSDIQREAATYSPEAIGSARLVFACTDDRDVNARVAADARAAGCWCNVADAPEASDFFVPAVLRRGAFTVAVGTGGAGPALAASIRDGLESHFEADFGILVDELRRARQIVRERIADSHARRRVLATLGATHSVELLRSGGASTWRDWLEQVIARAADPDQHSRQA